MSEFEEAKIVTESGVFKRAVIQKLPAPRTDAKAFKRMRIAEEVFDIYDSTADNAKMCLILGSLVAKLFDTLAPAARKKFTDEEIKMIEMISTNITEMKFDPTPEIVDIVMDRQKRVAEILSE